MPSVEETKQLKRTLGLGLVTFFGLGNILGAGIYVLVGKVAGLAGYYAPVAFVLASIVAALSGLSYAELSSRLPYSAGESLYIFEAFRRRWLALAVGSCIAAAGMVSAATISRGFAGYLSVFLEVPDALSIILLVVTMAALAVYGIRASVRLAAVITIVELAGLILVILIGYVNISDLPSRWFQLAPPSGGHIWFGVTAGAFLAFFAYIGFEDMVNVAEEVQAPQRNLPRAIILSLIISSILYLLVALTCVLHVVPRELAASDAPLALVYTAITGRQATLITQIALLAVVNGMIVQVIMASRILYGMSRQGWIWHRFGRIHPRTRTPVIATLFVALVILGLALWFPLVALARGTSYLILPVFVLINLSLIVLKRRQRRPHGVCVFPMWVPVAGFVSSTGLIVGEAIRALVEA